MVLTKGMGVAISFLTTFMKVVQYCTMCYGPGSTIIRIVIIIVSYQNNLIGETDNDQNNFSCLLLSIFSFKIQELYSWRMPTNM